MRDYLIGILVIIAGITLIVVACIAGHWIKEALPDWFFPLMFVLGLVFGGLYFIAPPIGKAVREFITR